MFCPSQPAAAPFHTAIRLALWGTLACAATAHAAPPLGLQSIAHTVVLGDTLERLALHYLGDARRWHLLQTSNRVADPRRLQPGSVLRIPTRLLPTSSATVEFVHGSVTRKTPDGTALVQPGQVLEEGAALESGQDSFVAVRLADGSVVRVQAQSEVQLQQLRRRGRAGSLQSVLEMHRGSVETSVPNQDKTPRYLEIRTPSASTSVRGTRFDVRLTPEGKTATAVVEGTVAVQARDAGQSSAGALLKPGQGVAVSAEGQVGTPRALLPMPDLSGVPEALHDAALLNLPLPALGEATKWQVEIAQDPQFTQVLRQGSFSAPMATWPVLADGLYQLRVRGVDAEGIPGYATQRPLRIKTRPIPPLAQSPAPGAILAQDQAELRCTEVPGVRWYHLQVAREEGFQDVQASAERQDECRLPLAGLALGRYYWRAASVQQLADGSADHGPFSPVQPFAIEARPAAVDALAEQGGGANLALHWTALPGQTFRLLLTRDPEGTQGVADEILEHPAWSAQGLPPGTYYVRIQVKSASGLQSEFSPPRKISVNHSVLDGSGLPLRTLSGTAIQSP
ncbi:FecR domain-containing protein [Acidovorax sp. YS12]|nr:FecR domain-containing protein [Acidovorax sp. YS12]